MNPSVPPARWTLVRALREHPVVYLLAGMVSTVLVVHPVSGSPYRPILSSVLCLMFGGVLLAREHPVAERTGLILFGVALVLPILVVQGSHDRAVRNELVGETFHLAGTWYPTGTFEVYRLDRVPGFARLHLPSWVLRERTSSLSADGPARTLVLTGTVRWPDRSGFAGYLRTHRYHGFLEVSRIHRVREDRSGGYLEGARARIANWLGAQSRDYPRSTSLMGALLLGRVESLPHFLRDLLRRLGISHLFVISGFHVGILFLVLGRCFDPLPRWIRFAAVLGCLILYLEMLRWPVSATRAGIMLAILSGCRTMGRRSSSMSVLLAAVVLMMLVNPLVLFQAGFQLSVGAMVGIGLLLPYRPLVEDVPGGLLALVSAGAFLGVLPVILVWFQYLAPLGAPLGYLASFLFPVLLGTLLVQGVLIGVNWSGPAGVMESMLATGIQYVDGWVQDSSLLVGVDPVRPMAGLLLAVGILFLVSAASRWPTRLVGGMIVIGLAVGAVSPGFSGRLEVSQVGQLAVTATGTRDGRTVVILPPQEQPGPREIEQLSRYLNRRGVFHVDLLVSTLPRRRFYRFNPTFTVGRHRVYWRRGPPIRWPGGEVNSDRAELRVPGLKIVYKRPPFLKDISTRSVRLVAFTDRGWCLVVPGPGVADSAGPAESATGCRWHDLSQKPFVWSTRRRRRVAPGLPRPGLYYQLRSFVRYYFVAP